MTTIAKADRLLDLLATKGGKAYDALAEAMRVEGTQMELLTRINRQLEGERCAAFLGQELMERLQYSLPCAIYL